MGGMVAGAPGVSGAGGSAGDRAGTAGVGPVDEPAGHAGAGGGAAGGAGQCPKQGAGRAPAFAFSPPLTPPRGGHAIEYLFKVRGERVMLAWSTASELVASTSGEGDAAFGEPAVVAEGYIEQISAALAADTAHFVWTIFNGGGWVHYGRLEGAFSDTPKPAGLGLLSAYNDATSYAARITARDNFVAASWNVSSLSGGPPIGERNGAFRVTSTTGGTSFSPPVKFQDVTALCPTLMATATHVVATWQVSLTTRQEIFVATSNDGGANFGEPSMLASAPNIVGCSGIIDDGRGGAIVQWYEGVYAGPKASYARRYDPVSATAGPAIVLASQGEAQLCATMAVSTTGRLALVRGTGHLFEDDWSSEVLVSEGELDAFSAPSPLDVVGPTRSCPLPAYTDSGALYLAWPRGAGFELVTSRGAPSLSCP